MVHVRYSFGEVIIRWRQLLKGNLILCNVPIISNLLNLMNSLKKTLLNKM